MLESCCLASLNLPYFRGKIIVVVGRYISECNVMSRLYKLGTCIIEISYISYDIEWNNNLFIHFSNLYINIFEFRIDYKFMYSTFNVLHNVQNLTHFKQLWNVNALSVLCNITDWCMLLFQFDFMRNCRLKLQVQTSQNGWKNYCRLHWFCLLVWTTVDCRWCQRLLTAARGY